VNRDPYRTATTSLLTARPGFRVSRIEGSVVPAMSLPLADVTLTVLPGFGGIFWHRTGGTLR